MPFHLWLRFLTRQKLVTLQRHHLGTRGRDPRREIRIPGGPAPATTADRISQLLTGHLTSPSRAAVKEETKQRVQAALEQMEGIDREVLVLRHLEDLTNAEAAQELGIHPDAASKRYVRALTRLKDTFDTNSEGGI
jgi:RNA polymerase sigma-70 factor (ECF subfamily)